MEVQRHLLLMDLVVVETMVQIEQVDDYHESSQVQQVSQHQIVQGL